MSYNDSDLGYDLGYDTETVITSRQIAPTQAQGYSHPVVYRMDLTVPSPLDIYRSIMTGGDGDDETVGASDPIGSLHVPPGYEDLAAAGSDLAALEGRTEGDVETGVAEHGDMVFSGSDAADAASDAAMEEIAGDSGILADMPGFTAGSRAMFREQYTGMSATELRALVAPREGESDEARSERIRSETISAFRTDVEARVRSRFAPGSVTDEEISLLAEEAVRQNLTGDGDYRPGETRRAVYSTIDASIPRGSRGASDTALHRAASERAAEAFEDAALSEFRGVDRAYYTRRPAGEARARTDARLLLEDRGIANDPEAIRALINDPETLHAAVEDFHTRIGNGPTEDGVLPTGRRRELMEAADLPLIDMSGLTEAQRVTLAAEEMRNRGEDERAERHELHEVAMETIREDFRREEMSTEHSNRMSETAFNQCLQMLGQFVNTMMGTTARLLETQVQGLNQMANPRAPDPWAAYNAASGNSRGSTSSYS